MLQTLRLGQPPKKWLNFSLNFFPIQSPELLSIELVF